MMRIAAVVLAAGGSTRMGRPKQLLPFRGQSLIHHAIDAALEAGCRPVVAVLGASAERIEADIARLEIIISMNPNWRDGPGSSIRAGVLAVEALTEPIDAILFLLCDQPRVDATHLTHLIDAGQSSGKPMAASAYAGTLGVPALFGRECFRALLSLDPRYGAKQLLNRDPDSVAAVPFPGGSIDLDTPADYLREASHVS
jgi:molybdenum cofactor cytidylyltransferase